MSYIEEKFSVKGKVAVLTGGGGILATQMAAGLFQAGAKVVLLDINEEAVKKSAESISKDDSDILALQCNVLDKDNIHSINDKIVEKFGKIDILVNAAGGNMVGATISPDKTFFDLNIEDFNKVVQLNLNGSVLPTLVLGETMSKQKFGSIINISSMATYSAISRVVGYSAAKAAIDNFTKWMAVELAAKFGEGLRVNAIAPGFLLTNQNRALLTNEDGSLTERGQQVIARTPFKRFGDPEELVGTVLWLSSAASKFVSGAIIPIDGGFSSYSGV